jgi:hypothetical protein
MPKFVPRQRKHKVLARSKTPAHEATFDSNATEILPQEQQERAQKKAALKDELTRESQGKMSGKKKKRLDKYIVRGDSMGDSRHLFAAICTRIALRRTSRLIVVGYKTQERREPRIAEEARDPESRHQLVPKLQEARPRSGYQEGGNEKGTG